MDQFNVTGVHAVNITMGTGSDTIEFQTNGSSITGTIDAGAGDTDVLSFAPVTDPVTVDLSTLTDFESVIGGAGSDSLVGDTNANTFTVTDVATGTVDGIAFQSFENLDGAGGDDMFVLQGTGAVTSIAGDSGSDTIDLAGKTDVTVNLTASATDGFAGTETSAGTFTGITTVTAAAGGTDTLNGLNGDAAWNLDATNTYVTSSRTLTFAGFDALGGNVGRDAFNVVSGTPAVDITGGDDNDSLVLADGTGLDGTFVGGTGTDTLDLLAFTSVQNFAIQTTTTDGFRIAVAGVISGTTDDIESLIGTSTPGDSDILTGADADATWLIGATDQYVLGAEILSVNGIETRTGGNMNDIFSVQVEAIDPNADHGINGGLGEDLIELSFGAGQSLSANATLTVNGGDPISNEDGDVVNINTSQSNDGARNVGILFRSSATSSVDVTGLGGFSPIGIDGVEELNYNGDFVIDDQVTVTATTGNDDITVRQTINGGEVFLNGNPFESAGIEGGGFGPDISLSGIDMTNGFNVDGGGGIDDLLLDADPEEDIMVSPTSPTSGKISNNGFADINYTNFDDFASSQPITFALNAGAGQNDGTPDQFVLDRNGGLVEFTSNGTLIFSEDAADVTSVVVNGSNDDDTLTVDFANGDPIPANGITYNGGGQVTTDDLVIDGTSTEDVVYTPSDDTPGDGTVTVDGSTINFTGLEPVRITDVLNFTLLTPNGSDVLTVDSSAANQNRISGTSGGIAIEPVVFDNVTNVIIDAATNGTTTNTDSISINSVLDATGLASFTVNTGPGNDTINGSGNTGSLGMALNGGDGNDTITGGAGNDAIDGGMGTDTIAYTIDGSQTLTDTSYTGTGQGTDTITNIDAAALTGGANADTIDASGFSGTAAIMGLAGNDIITGGAGTSTLDGGADNDTITAGNGTATIVGGAGNDCLSGGLGNDLIQGDDGDDSLLGGLGNDTLEGGAGIGDTVFEVGFRNYTLTTSLLIGGGSNPLSGIELAHLTGSFARDTIDASGFNGAGATLIGGAGKDTLIGSPGADLLMGQARQDLLIGNGGNDVLRGGGGRDTLDGGAGDDRIFGQGGANDLVIGGLGDDTLNGGSGFDRAQADADADFTLTNSSLTGQGSDVLMQIEAVIINGGASANTIDASGTSLQTVINGGAGSDTITGGQGMDSLLGGDGADLINAGVGNDTVNGGGGNDTLDGGADTDLLQVMANANLTITDAQTTGTGTDQHSNFEAALLMAGTGNNRLDASNTSLPVTLIGGDGNDTLNGGMGTDSIDGGNGIDAIEFVGTNVVVSDATFPGPGSDTIVSVEGVRIVASGLDATLDASGFTLGMATIIGSAGNDTLRGGSMADSIDGGDGADDIAGNGGADVINGGEGADLIDAGAGADTVNGGAGADSILGGDGDDQLFGNNGADTLRGGEGADSIFGGTGMDILFGDNGADSLDGGDGEDGLNGGEGSDFLNGMDGSDTLLAFAGNDTLFGGAGVDVLLGGDGDDQLDGQGSMDTLAGAGGVDTFLDAAQDLIDETFLESDFPSIL